MVKSKARRAPPPTPPARRSSAIAKGRLPPPTPPAATPAANSTCASAAAAPASGPSAPPVLARGARRRAAARARTAATRAWATSGSRGAAPAPSPTKAAKRWGLVLKGLGEALPEVDLDADADGPAPRKGGVAADRAHVPNLGRPKARRRLAVEEGVAVRGVLEHPAYAADPLAVCCRPREYSCFVTCLSGEALLGPSRTFSSRDFCVVSMSSVCSSGRNVVVRISHL